MEYSPSTINKYFLYNPDYDGFMYFSTTEKRDQWAEETGAILAGEVTHVEHDGKLTEITWPICIEGNKDRCVYCGRIGNDRIEECYLFLVDEHTKAD